MSPPQVEPLRKTRLIALALCWALNTVTGPISVHTLMRVSHTKSALRHAAPPSVALTIDMANILAPIIIVTTATILLNVAASLFLQLLLLPKPVDRWLRRYVPAGVAVPLRAQAAVLAAGALLVLPAHIAYTVVFATRAPGVRALGDRDAAGAVPYSKIGYLRAQEVAPWVSGLATGVAAAVLFTAARRRVREEGAGGVEASK
ncbi:hypothetical protein FA95DRAFT_1605965 [Auriscalpium vulgare]|uniref:Uncharacterized protein n=1 Tax=Auriscalpium vulgare TaxID=40419 RepID=A0ACB8RV78_9AGAM|nr:hypothetical protein FA95DRAFT_1605965 [Auriscalpium vulgare]